MEKGIEDRTCFDVDDEFYNRADEHINLSNEQALKEKKGKVSASMMYATARYNAHISGCECNSMEEMRLKKEEIVDYFISQYRLMLQSNLDEYIENFDEYMKVN